MQGAATCAEPTPTPNPEDVNDYTLPDPPARWDPCTPTPIGVRVNTANAPDSAIADTREALRRLGDASGLRFTYQGRTNLVPESTFDNYPSDTQIVVAWADPAETDLLNGNQVGRGGYAMRRGYRDAQGEPVHRIMRGGVALDQSSPVSQRSGFGVGPTLGELLMHELGHVVGLQHAERSAQLMYPTLQGSPDDQWGPGDLTGLALQGAEQGCLTQVEQATRREVSSHAS